MPVNENTYNAPQNSPFFYSSAAVVYLQKQILKDNKIPQLMIPLSMASIMRKNESHPGHASEENLSLRSRQERESMGQFL